MQYRREVDGLRAFAVLPVMLFHAGFAFLPGGFLGVDIFFVISGFLITSLIQRDLELGRFSIVNFYLRRFRRILPALIVMMALTVPLAYRLMIPDDLENYGQSLVATAVSANNILLYLTQDYFAMEAEFKPLIHTWSLGVEEQYYFIVPLLMSLCFALGRKRMVAGTIAALTITSFAACLWLQRHNPNANFYLIFSRAWELGIGALAALSAPRAPDHRTPAASAAALVGFAAAIVPMALFDGHMGLPGTWTLLPVAGTALVLLFAGPENPMGRLLGWGPFVGIGLLSYSAYLYHQPVFAFVRIARLSPPSVSLLLALVPLVFALAYLSWRFVEQPFRHARQVSTPVMLSAVAIGSMALGAVGLSFYVTSGFYHRWPELASDDPGFGAKQNIAYNTLPRQYLDQPFGPARPRILVLGNSFARDFVNMGIAAGAFTANQLSYGEINECDPLSAKRYALVRQADFVVMGSGINGTDYPNCLVDLARELRGVTKAPVILLGTKGFGWNNNAVMLLDPAQRYAYRAHPLPDLVAADRKAARLLAADNYVSIFALISDAQGRVPVFTPDHKFISQDRKHLTKAGAAYIGRILFRHPLLAPLARH